MSRCAITACLDAAAAGDAEVGVDVGSGPYGLQHRAAGVVEAADHSGPHLGQLHLHRSGPLAAQVPDPDREGDGRTLSHARRGDDADREVRLLAVDDPVAACRWIAAVQALPAIEEVPSRAALQLVVAGAAEDAILAVPGIDEVVARAGADDVVTAAAEDAVRAALGHDDIPPGSALHHLRLGRADHGRLLAIAPGLGRHRGAADAGDGEQGGDEREDDDSSHWLSLSVRTAPQA